MNVILIKWRPRWDAWQDNEELVGIAVGEAAAKKHVDELAIKYPDCYGYQHGHWAFEDFNLIEE